MLKKIKELIGELVQEDNQSFYDNLDQALVSKSADQSVLDIVKQTASVFEDEKCPLPIFGSLRKTLRIANGLGYAGNIKELEDYLGPLTSYTRKYSVIFAIGGLIAGHHLESADKARATLAAFNDPKLVKRLVRYTEQLKKQGYLPPGVHDVIYPDLKGLLAEIKEIKKLMNNQLLDYAQAKEGGIAAAHLKSFANAGFFHSFSKEKKRAKKLAVICENVPPSASLVALESAASDIASQNNVSTEYANLINTEIMRLKR